jgi:hypothetical protein
MEGTGEYGRDEVEAAFRHYFLTGPVGEDWAAWSRLFTDDATYNDHFWGVFRGPAEIQQFLEGTMSFAPHVYSPLVWYNIDGSRVVYQVVNRADSPSPGGDPIDFPSLQVIRYAGGLVDRCGDEAVQPAVRQGEERRRDRGLRPAVAAGLGPVGGLGPAARRPWGRAVLAGP